MVYEVEVLTRARRALESLARGTLRDYLKVDEAIDALSGEPRPRGARKLMGAGALYRLGVGDYRIIYSVIDSDHLVVVENVLRRTSTTYRKR